MTMLDTLRTTNGAFLPIPAEKGSYVLILHLDQERNISIGKLGVFLFPEGMYLYCGNAFGSGGLRARVTRHLMMNSHHLHWHIDYLLRYARVRGVYYALTNAPLECFWSQSLASLAAAFIPAPRFGATDCQSGCPAHLIGFPTDYRNERWQSALRLPWENSPESKVVWLKIVD